MNGNPIPTTAWQTWLGTLFPNSRATQERRERYIDNYQFPTLLLARFASDHPHLGPGQCGMVWGALREYFQLCRMARNRMVAMPSPIVDEAWHEFILFTHDYNQFCHNAFGRFLHHTPAAGGSNLLRQPSNLAWKLSCQRTGQNPALPVYLPTLFEIDRQLGLPEAPNYELGELAAPFRYKTSNHDGSNSGAGCGGSSCSSSSGGGCGDSGGSSCGGSSCGGGGCGGGGD
jgi:uncharacterized membrane protein YgcG